MNQDLGIAAIVKQQSSKLLKIVWILVLSASLWGLGYYVSENYIKLNINPEILVKARYVNSRTIPFPALTVCSPFPIKMEFLNTSKFFENLQRGTNPELEDRKIMTAFSQTCNHYYNLMEPYKNLTLDPDHFMDIVNKMRPKMEDLFDYCTVGSRIDCKNIFVRSLTTLGNCFTFNLVGYHTLFNANLSADFNGYKRKNITKSWSPKAEIEYHDDEKDKEPSNWTIHKGYSTNDDWAQPLRAAGLQYCIIATSINSNEFTNFCESSFNAHRVIFHLPDEIPTFSNVFTTVTIGKFKYMRISATIQKTDESLKQYPPDYRKCFFENERQLKFLKSYTKLNCELECMTNFTYETCGCVAFWMPRSSDMKICKFEKIMCYRNIYYKWSSSYYEDDENEQNFPDFPCNCLPTCTKIKYSIINEFLALRTQKSPNSISSAFQIVFGDSQVLESTNYVTYKIQNFVSDIGGLLGLFLGFSLLSLFELILRAIIFIKNFIRKSSSLENNQPSTHNQLNKSRKRRTNRGRKKRIQDSTNPDVVVIDLLFGEQVKAGR